MPAVSNKVKSSGVWRFFTVDPDHPKYAKCALCETKVSVGSEDPRYRCTSSLTRHLNRIHPDEMAEEMKTTKKRPADDEPVQIFNLKSKKQRTDMFQQTIPQFVESKMKLPFNSSKAQGFHKSIFEMMIIDTKSKDMIFFH